VTWSLADKTCGEAADAGLLSHEPRIVRRKGYYFDRPIRAWCSVYLDSLHA
jgi:hypothetical protein